jgi:hypothetical protein
MAVGSMGVPEGKASVPMPCLTSTGSAAARKRQSITGGGELLQRENGRLPAKL